MDAEHKRLLEDINENLKEISMTLSQICGNSDQLQTRSDGSIIVSAIEEAVQAIKGGNDLSDLWLQLNSIDTNTG